MELRESIVRYLLNERGLEYKPNQIIASARGKQPLYNVFQAICDQDDEVILPSPYWVSYPEQIKLSGAVPVIVSCDETTNFKITPEKLAEVITPKTKAVVITSPNNPTGSVYSENELKALGNVLKDYSEIFIISDEIYDQFVYEGKHISLPLIFPELLNRTIITNGFSKVFAMTGWRLGYIAAPSDIAEAIASFQSHATGSPSTISQYAGISALNGFDKSMVEEYKKRRDILVDGLNQIEGIQCTKPNGAFYAFPNVSQFFGTMFEDQQIIDAETFCHLLLEKQHVSAVPAQHSESRTTFV
nr:pyridoxal phosphate-dependent aminotransferase [Bacillus velezensis]